METYRERIEEIFDSQKKKFSLTDDQKDSFIKWALQRHTRLKARDKKWLDKHPECEMTLPEAGEYFIAVLNALKNCEGKDYYTGDPLDWGVSFRELGVPVVASDETNCPTKVRQKRITFDHVHGRDLNKLEFVMCAGKTNDAKNDLTQKEFLDLCESVLKHHGYKVSGPSGVSGLSSQEK